MKEITRIIKGISRKYWKIKEITRIIKGMSRKYWKMKRVIKKHGRIMGMFIDIGR